MKSVQNLCLTVLQNEQELLEVRACVCACVYVCGAIYTINIK